MSQNEQEKNKKASSEEIESMCNFIGGFEKWPLLNDDCKRKVLEVLDINTRLSLGYCSKGDYLLMNTTPFRMYSIELDDTRKDHPAYQEEEFDNVTIYMVRKKNGGHNTWVFSQLGEDTQVRWYPMFQRKKPGCFRGIILKNCNYNEEAVKFAEMWMKRCQFKMEYIEINVERYPMERSQIVSLPKCTSVILFSNTEDEFRWWLEKVPAKLRSLALYNYDGVLPRDFLFSQKITNANRLNIRCETDFSDEQLLSLTGTDITLRADRLTDGGINQFIKRWIDGNSVKDFKKLFLKFRPQVNVEAMLKDVEFWEWDEEFRERDPSYAEEFQRFWGPGETYQIPSKWDPYESLTLHVFEDEDVCIAHTGKRRWRRNGDPFTDYWIPCPL